MKETERERQILHSMIYTWNLKKPNSERQEQNGGCQRLEVVVEEIQRLWSKGTNFQLKDE